MIYAQLSSKIHAVHSKAKAITEKAVESSYHLISFKALPKLLFANIRAGAHIGLNSFYKRIPRTNHPDQWTELPNPVVQKLLKRLLLLVHEVTKSLSWIVNIPYFTLKIIGLKHPLIFSLNCQIAVQKYIDYYPAFEMSRECKFIKVLFFLVLKLSVNKNALLPLVNWV